MHVHRGNVLLLYPRMLSKVYVYVCISDVYIVALYLHICVYRYMVFRDQSINALFNNLLSLIEIYLSIITSRNLFNEKNIFH